MGKQTETENQRYSGGKSHLTGKRTEQREVDRNGRTRQRG